MAELDWQAACREYVGRSQRQVDELPISPANLLLATLNDSTVLKQGDALPALFHWLYFNSPVLTENLKADGHEKMGIFLPPVQYPRRMWAGSKLAFNQPLLLGQKAERVSVINSVEFKTGSSGPLCFVNVEHTFQQDNVHCFTEIQTIVYREPASPGTEPALTDNERDEHLRNLSGHTDNTDQTEHADQSVGAVVLFRYSALTFNAHRIHYDRDYVRQEGYPGLVVHGPLMATLLMRHAQGSQPSRLPAEFSFRGLSPLFENERFQLHAEDTTAGSDLSLLKSNGGKAVSAAVRWS